MSEALIVMGGLIALGALAWLGPLVPLEWIVTAGVACTTLGMLLGVPTGLWYHVRLYAALRRQGPLPARWWLRPHGLHGRLGDGDRREVLCWFYLGGAGFALTAAGCALVVLAVGLAYERLD